MKTNGLLLLFLIALGVGLQGCTVDADDPPEKVTVTPGKVDIDR